MTPSRWRGRAVVIVEEETLEVALAGDVRAYLARTCVRERAIGGRSMTLLGNPLVEHRLSLFLSVTKDDGSTKIGFPNSVINRPLWA
jgi:hypothetical protein